MLIIPLLLVILLTLLFFALILSRFYISGRFTTRTNDRFVISAIASVLRQHLPVSSGLSLMAEAESVPVKRILLKVSGSVRSGLSLSAALKKSYPRCSGMVMSLITTGEKTGNLTAAANQAEQWEINRTKPLPSHMPNITVYAVILLAATVLASAFMMILIIPKFEEIFRDYDTALPPLMVYFINISNWLITAPGIWLLLGFYVALPLILYLFYRPRRTPVPDWPSLIADWFRWHLPYSRRFQFNIGLSVMLQTIRQAINSGMDIAVASRLAANVDVNWYLRQKMLAFSQAVSDGYSPQSAARTIGFGPVVESAVASGMKTGNMDQALQYAAEYHTALVNRRQTIIRNVAWPAGTVIIGTVVGLLVVACFQPLVRLIDSSIKASGY